MPRAEREQQMLQVAGQVFAERGYHAASMDEIAAGVGVAKPMLYSYFGSKEGLYLAAVRRQSDRLLEALREVGALADPADQLRAGALAFFAFVAEQRAGWAVLFREAAAGGGALALQVAESRRALATTVGALLRRLAPAATSEHEPLAEAVVGAGESLANWWIAHPGETPERMADRFMAVVWNGLAALTTASGSTTDA